MCLLSLLTQIFLLLALSIAYFRSLFSCLQVESSFCLKSNHFSNVYTCSCDLTRISVSVSYILEIRGVLKVFGSNRTVIISSNIV